MHVYALSKQANKAKPSPLSGETEKKIMLPSPERIPEFGDNNSKMQGQNSKIR